jgi:hypothetical protein
MSLTYEWYNSLDFGLALGGDGGSDDEGDGSLGGDGEGD